MATCETLPQSSEAHASLTCRCAEQADHPLYQTTRSLEFYLHVYFAICPLLDGADEETLQREMMAFRRYVESESRKGGLLAQSADFAAYAGLFLVPQPHKNPAYKGLFQEEWTASLRERVHAYLAVVLGVTPVASSCRDAAARIDVAD